MIDTNTLFPTLAKDLNKLEMEGLKKFLFSIQNVPITIIIPMYLKVLFTEDELYIGDEARRARLRRHEHEEVVLGDHTLVLVDLHVDNHVLELVRRHAVGTQGNDSRLQRRRECCSESDDEFVGRAVCGTMANRSASRRCCNRSHRPSRC